IIFSGSSARSRTELRLALMMSVSREKIPMTCSFFARDDSAEEQADHQADDEHQPVLAGAAAQVVERAAGQAVEAVSMIVAAVRVGPVVHAHVTIPRS